MLLCVVGPPAESTRKREVESEKASSLSTFIREHRSVQHSLDPRPLIRFLTARFTRAFISRGVTNSM